MHYLDRNLRYRLVSVISVKIYNKLAPFKIFFWRRTMCCIRWNVPHITCHSVPCTFLACTAGTTHDSTDSDIRYIYSFSDLSHHGPIVVIVVRILINSILPLFPRYWYLLCLLYLIVPNFTRHSTTDLSLSHRALPNSYVQLAMNDKAMPFPCF